MTEICSGGYGAITSFSSSFLTVGQQLVCAISAVQEQTGQDGPSSEPGNLKHMRDERDAFPCSNHASSHMEKPG